MCTFPSSDLDLAWINLVQNHYKLSGHKQLFWEVRNSNVSLEVRYRPATIVQADRRIDGQCDTHMLQNFVCREYDYCKIMSDKLSNNMTLSGIAMAKVFIFYWLLNYKLLIFITFINYLLKISLNSQIQLCNINLFSTNVRPFIQWKGPIVFLSIFLYLGITKILKRQKKNKFHNHLSIQYNTFHIYCVIRS